MVMQMDLAIAIPAATSISALEAGQLIGTRISPSARRRNEQEGDSN
jgi:hypothetical protein